MWNTVYSQLNILSRKGIRGGNSFLLKSVFNLIHKYLHITAKKI